MISHDVLIQNKSLADGRSDGGGDGGCSPPITQEERDMANSGDLKGFWGSRYARGDAWGAVGASMWGAPNMPARYGVASSLAIQSLVGSLMVQGQPNGGFFTVRRTRGITEQVQQIGVDLALEHISEIEQTSSGALSNETVARYHHRVFENHGLPPTVYGGTPLGGDGGSLEGVLGSLVSQCRNE